MRSRSGGTPTSEDDAMVRRAMVAIDPEEFKRVGNEQYREGCFEEALKLYDPCWELRCGSALPAGQARALSQASTVYRASWSSAAGQRHRLSELERRTGGGWQQAQGERRGIEEKREGEERRKREGGEEG